MSDEPTINPLTPKPDEAAADRRVRVYKDQAGEWRWQRVAMNGQIVAVSGEGYGDLSGATEAAEREFPDDMLIVDKGTEPPDPVTPQTP